MGRNFNGMVTDEQLEEVARRVPKEDLFFALVGQETWRVRDYQLTGENGVYVIGHGEPNSELLVDDAMEVTEPIIRRKVNGKRGVGWVEFAQDLVGDNW